MIEDILTQLKSVEPQYELTLPFSKKKVQYKPFKIKDQKILTLIAEETNIGLLLKQLCEVIKNCSSEKTPEQLYLCDFEYLFLKIRSKSVEEKIHLIIETDVKKKVTINIDDIQYKDGKVKQQIIENDDIILELTYPKVKDYFDLETIDVEFLFSKIISSISIKKQKYDLTLIKSSEMQKLIDNISVNNANKFQEFIQQGPSLKYTIETESDPIILEGFLRFFT